MAQTQMTRNAWKLLQAAAKWGWHCNRRWRRAWMARGGEEKKATDDTWLTLTEWLGVPDCGRDWPVECKRCA